jgi:hypothetical protein
MDELNCAIREAEEFLFQAKTEEIRELLRRKYFELLKRKYEGTSETKVSEEVREPRESGESRESREPEEPREPEELENLLLEKLPKVVEKITKLHVLRKFKIDEDTIQEFYRNHKGRIHEFFIHLAKYLPKYFENNKEMLEYNQNKCYVGLLVKVIYSKDHEDQVDEYFVPHRHKRRYLAQSLADLTEIMIDQVPIIEGNITEFIRNGSGYVVTGIKSVKLEVTPFKPGIRKARGYIPLYPWLRNRRDIVNIQNKDSLCFWKCLYRAFHPDPWRHDYRDVPASELQEFMAHHGFDIGIFEHGYTNESLAIFEEKYKISVNIYDIGKNGPEETKPYYCSIYNGDPNVTKVNLGIIRNDEEGEVHFVLVRKLHVVFTKANANCRHVKMCQDCGIVCSTTEQLLNHYKVDHKDECGGYCSVGELSFVNVYNKENQCIVGFDMNSLYPTAMLHPMPLSDFQWISRDEGKSVLLDPSYNWLESETGYWLEVDIECPKEIDDRVAAYSLFPEKIDGKLKATLFPKVQYKAHIANL